MLEFQGLKSSVIELKSRTSEFTRELGDVNACVFFLQETWRTEDISTACPYPGYREIVFQSTELKGVTQCSDSGGISIHSIEFIEKGEFSVWLKI